MICKKCGNEVLSEATFCTKCGEKIQDKRFCMRCKSEISPESDVCNKCGASQVDNTAKGFDSSEKKKNKTRNIGLIALVSLIVLLNLTRIFSCVFGGERFTEKKAENLLEDMFEAIKAVDFDKLDEITTDRASYLRDFILDGDEDYLKQLKEEGKFDIDYKVKAEGNSFVVSDDKTEATGNFRISLKENGELQMDNSLMKFDFKKEDGKWKISEIYSY